MASDAWNADESWLSHLERRAALGQIDRRGFLKLAAALGVQATVSDFAFAAPGERKIAAAYDYIVVGAGSAGCAVAARLAEGGARKVLLLEAGGADTERASLTSPHAWGANCGKDVDWGYQTTPQARANNRVFDWPRGKVVGGSSSINAMIWVWGHQADFDGWAYAGNEGWDYARVKPVFQSIETSTRAKTGAGRGTSGPMHVGSMSRANPLNQAFFESCRQAGHAVHADVNGPIREGAGLMDLSVKDDKRFSVAHGYLMPALQRENFTLVTGATVEKLLFAGTRCTGVRVRIDGNVRDIVANEETILSSGALDSPRLLLQSGVGNADELRKLGIKPVADLPGVGENLHDHLMLNAFVAEVREPLNHNGFRTDSHVFYRTNGNGFVPDIQTIFVPAALNPSLQRNQGYSMLVGLVRPQSRGRLKLATAEPGGPLLIDPGYLTAQADLDALVDGAERARDIGMAGGFAPIRKRDTGQLPRGREAIADYVRRNCQSYWHPVGTCAMGLNERAVVNPQLQVRGVERLRIADASVMPTITTGNTNAPAIMIGERAARMIAA